MTEAQLRNLLRTLAAQKLQALVDRYTAVNTNNAAAAEVQRLLIVKITTLEDIVNAGLAQLAVIDALGPVTP